jgi:outer membrane protein OmpA-like peptidoglycan-associated protein
MKKSFLILILISFSSMFLFAQSDVQKNKYGVFGGLNFNMHQANFTQLPGIPNCCPRFETGTGLGFHFGVLYERKLSNKFWLGGNLSILPLNATLTHEEETSVNLDSGPAVGAFEHKVESEFLNFGIEPRIIYNPVHNLNLSVGPRLGYNMSYSFSQVETIIKPDGYGTFLDEFGNDTRSRTRNEASGDIQNPNKFQMGLIFAVGYEFPLNYKNSFRLAPEVSYYLGFNDLAEQTEWRANSLRATLAIKYAPQPPEPIKEIFKYEQKIDTLTIESDLIARNTFRIGTEQKSIKTQKIDNEMHIIEFIQRTDSLFIPKLFKLDGSITAVGVNHDNQEVPHPVFKIEEYVSNRLDPLLNYIFFEENSSKLPNKYTRLSKAQSENFDIESLFIEPTLTVYYNLLNIIAIRLKDYPNAKAVRDYLVNIWGIDNSRIKIEARNLPAKASTPKTEPDKIAENRRVEIYSDEYKIVEPLFIEKIDRRANPPIVRFKINAESEAGLSSWKVEAFQKSNDIDRFVHFSNDKIKPFIDWELDKFQKVIPKIPEPIEYSLTLEDVKGGKKILDNNTLPIDVVTLQEKRTEQMDDYAIERFSLILFDFDDATIDQNNKNIIDFISSRIYKESEIEITGHTDRTGDAEYNRRLSERRAISVKNALRKDANAYGIGKDTLLYDNDQPEGRFYCRTVNIIVKTPVE